MSKKKQIIVIAGATASGKTKLAIDLALKNNSEIICADSRSVYKGFDIVSAKVREPEMCGVKHHLLDIIEPTETFSAGDFKARALPIAEDIFSRGKGTIICGGTWFYISAVLGFSNISNVSPNTHLRAELEQKSSLVLFDMLLELNEARAREIEPNNRERVIRGIEVALAKHECGDIVTGGDVCLSDEYEIKFHTVELPRNELYSRIDGRVDLMIEMGLEEEYAKNREKWGDLPIFENTIGYGEFVKLEQGVYPTRDFAISKIKQHTRNFAKRQLTWLNSLTAHHVRTNMR